MALQKAVTFELKEAPPRQKAMGSSIAFPRIDNI